MTRHLGPVARTLNAAIGCYQRFLSPMLGQRCRFAPSCSEYARESIVAFGALTGSWLTVRRLVRCQPLCAGGWDPVPQERPHRHLPHRHRSVQAPSAERHASTSTGATP